MTTSANYIKLVEWSPEDNAYIGQCPGIIGPSCHGTDEVEVYRQICDIVDDWLTIMQESGQPLPPPTAGRNIAGLMN